MTIMPAGQQPSGAQTVTRPRAAMTLTSRLRRLAAAGAAFLHAGETQASIGTARFDALTFFGNQNAFMPTISMAVNPKSVKWSQPKRWVKKDTREGSVFFHFTNAKGQNQDVLTLSFSGNTGNIDLQGSLANSPGADTGALYKLLVWHNLYLMSREPMLLGDGTENLVTMVYSSPLFPVEVAFDGFFSKVVEFEETAEKPNSRNYSFEFTVTRAEPDLDEALQALTSILHASPSTPVFTNPTDGGVFIDRPVRPTSEGLPASAELPTV